jgi:hypothetical protein
LRSQFPSLKCRAEGQPLIRLLLGLRQHRSVRRQNPFLRVVVLYPETLIQSLAEALAPILVELAKQTLLMKTRQILKAIQLWEQALAEPLVWLSLALGVDLPARLLGQ